MFQSYAYVFKGDTTTINTCTLSERTRILGRERSNASKCPSGILDFQKSPGVLSFAVVACGLFCVLRPALIRDQGRTSNTLSVASMLVWKIIVMKQTRLELFEYYCSPLSTFSYGKESRVLPGNLSSSFEIRPNSIRNQCPSSDSPFTKPTGRLGTACSCPR